jgi:adenosine deaminase
MDLNWLQALPKVELHLHLEGAIPHHALWNLVQKYGGDQNVPSYEHLLEKFSYRDFPEFIETWKWKNQFLRNYDDFTYISEQVALDLMRQNIRYAEMFISPPDFKRQGLKTQLLVESVRKGLSRVDGIEIGLIPDLVRDYGPKQAEETLMELIEVRDLGVIGVGLGGSEQLYPARPFSNVFRLARKFGLFISIHAGEAGGAESVWDAIFACHPDRIGHGTSAIEDQGLLDYLRENQIPLEMCPTSNLRTGVVKSIRDHPIKAYYDLGIAITVNTDDPKMFGNSLASEYQLLISQLDFTPDDIRSLISQGVLSSWLPDKSKEILLKEFQEHPTWHAA